MGGSIVLLACLSLVLPITAVVPLVSAVLVGAQLFRFITFYRYINWAIAVPFVGGAVVGAAIGAYSYALMPDYLLCGTLGVTLLAILWLPRIRLRFQLPYPYWWLGAVHTWLSTITGLGGLLQGTLLRGNYTRHAIIGTIAASLSCMSILKVVGYIAVGFDFSLYWWAICLATLVSVPGTWVGKHALKYVSDHQFRWALRWFLTLFSLRLFWLAYGLYESPVQA